MKGYQDLDLNVMFYYYLLCLNNLEMVAKKIIGYDKNA